MAIDSSDQYWRGVFRELSPARILGITFAVAIHAAALMLLMAPATAPERAEKEDDAVRVVFIEPPPPPPPPPPPKVEPPPPPPSTVIPPTVTPLPPADLPPILVDEPSPVDIYQPPAPPAPPAAPAAPDMGASVDISSKNLNPPRYPYDAEYAGHQGRVVLIIDVDENGNVTHITIGTSSGYRSLDQAAVRAARKWRFNPSIVNGRRVPGRVPVPVNFVLEG